mgnify:CR=1 FL=1
MIKKNNYELFKKNKTQDVLREALWFADKSRKGTRFVFDDLPLHKNKSFLCIRKAIYDYFIKGIEPEVSIKENKNIFDFCGGKKANAAWEYWEEYIKQGQHKKDKLQKTVRYYISNKKLKDLGWNIKIDLDTGLKRLIENK